MDVNTARGKQAAGAGSNTDVVTSAGADVNMTDGVMLGLFVLRMLVFLMFALLLIMERLEKGLVTLLSMHLWTLMLELPLDPGQLGCVPSAASLREELLIEEEGELEGERERGQRLCKRPHDDNVLT